MRAPLAVIILVSFFITGIIGPMPLAMADEFRLPAPGVMVRLSPPLDPPILKGIKVHLDNPFRFDFILDKGDRELSNVQLKNESSKLIKYFLASLTIPEKDLWVNLSPYEKDRIIPNSFGLTEMGRDLLAEDYMLKQITASLIYPEDEIGKKFWKRIYEEAEKRYGTTNIPVNTFNKVWIVPAKAVVYENAKAGTAYVVESKLKVMLEQDYLSLAKHEGIQSGQSQVKDTNQLGSQIVREIVIPELTTEVNENKNFTRLRQVYNSLILATWYKKKIKDSILSQVYSDKNKVAGVNINDPKEKERIYRQYLRAFKKGVYNYIKEDIDPVTQETIPRKYFSGGVVLGLRDSAMNTSLSIAGAALEIENDPQQVLTQVDGQLDGRNQMEIVEEETNPTSGNIFNKTSTSTVESAAKLQVKKNEVAQMDRTVAPLNFPVRQFMTNVRKEFEIDNPLMDKVIAGLGNRLDMKQAQNLLNIAILIKQGQLPNSVLELLARFAKVKGMDRFILNAQIKDLKNFINMMRQLAVAQRLEQNHHYMIAGIEVNVGTKDHI